jgi:hypothetical protein
VFPEGVSPLFKHAPMAKGKTFFWQNGTLLLKVLKKGNQDMD